MKEVSWHLIFCSWGFAAKQEVALDVFCCRSSFRQQLKAPGTLGSLGNGASPSPFPEFVLICAGAISMQLATVCSFRSILSYVLNQQPTALTPSRSQN